MNLASPEAESIPIHQVEELWDDEVPVDLNRHPLSSLWPDMPAADFEALIESIQSDGLLEPVVLYEDQVLDGWHRYQACDIAEVEPRFTTYQGSDPARYVIAQNLHRRQLTPAQRADAVVAASNWVKRGSNQHSAAQVEGGSNDPSSEEQPQPVTTQEMAEQAQVSTGTIKRAKARLRAEQQPLIEQEPQPEAAEPGDEPLPDEPPPPSKPRRNRDKQIANLELQVQAQGSIIEDLERKNQSLTAAMMGDCQEELAKCWAENETLRSQLEHYQTEAARK